MRTSTNGIRFLELHEGVVLRAYRDPVGIWTIGAGLTKMSGVVTPKAGMVLTRTEATRLLDQALERNYEPRVLDAMPGAAQHEFDGDVSFDFNTGAIHKASWVKAWAAGQRDEVRRRLGLWKKAGGRVLPGLVRRRGEEADLILDGVYHGVVERSRPPSGFARIVVRHSRADITRIREQLTKLGYDPGDTAGSIVEHVVRQFQRDHGLTVDGIIGAATISTLQRRIDARTAPAAPAAIVAAGGGAAVGAPTMGVEDLLAGLPPDMVGWGLAVLGLAWLGKTGTDYRDVIAAKIQGFAPGAATYLRSF